MSIFEEKSMPAIFQNRAVKHSGTACVGYKTQQGEYADISWDEMNEMIHNLAYFLMARGVQPNDKIALFSENRFEWWVADQAILSIGAVNVPIYATNSAEEARYVIENSDSRMCLTGTLDHLEKILQVKPKLPLLNEVVVFDKPATKAEGVLQFQEVLDEGRNNANRDELERRINQIDPSSVATLIYTSGTTGNPKGVMLSHNNFVANAKQLYAVAPHLFDERPHTILSFLPLSHSFERTVGYYLPIYACKDQPHKVVFAEDFSKILENFQEVRPTFVVSVPRLYEKIHAGINSKLGDASNFKKALFAWAMSVSRRNLAYICNNRPRTGLFAFEFNLAYKMIFSKILAALGMDQLEFALSGGGPLSQSDAEFFLGMDIKVLEGFGLTETTPVTHANHPELIKPGTVGPPLKDTLARIGADGELQIKGPQVMLGYYKNEAATKEVMTSDGYFCTGDIGEIDADGYLKITGRLKDIIITSGGKNISPQNIENSLKASAYIEQIAIIGDNRKYLSALIVPVFEELEHWANNNGISFSSHADLITNQQVQHLFEEEITRYTVHFARVEQIRKFKLLEHEWSQETDELTPTMKLKRRVINQKYSGEIESMYNL